MDSEDKFGDTNNTLQLKNVSRAHVANKDLVASSVMTVDVRVFHVQSRALYTLRPEKVWDHRGLHVNHGTL